MENKYVGYLLLGVSVLVIILVVLFNSALKEIITESCSEIHGEFCPMTQTLNQQTYIALGVVGLLVIVSIALIFSKPQKEIIFKTRILDKKKKKIDLTGLTREEIKVLNFIQESKAIFQAELIEKTEIGKVKISRILDRLESKGLIERKRRGMNNIVVIRD